MSYGRSPWERSETAPFTEKQTDVGEHLVCGAKPLTLGLIHTALKVVLRARGLNKD